MIWIILAFAAIIIIETARIAYTALLPKLDKNFSAYSQSPFNQKNKIIVVGDSFAYGVGASTPEKSLIGNLGKHLPQTKISNYSKRRATIKVLYKLATSQDIKHSDTALVIGGGMDIITFTSLSKIQRALDELLTYLNQHTKEIIVIIPISPTSLPLYSVLERMIFFRRANKIQKLFREVATQHRCQIITLDTQPILSDVKKYFFSDLSHPNDLGYEFCFNQIKPYFSKLK